MIISQPCMSMCFTCVSVSHCHLDICVNPAWAGWQAASQWAKESYKRAAFPSFIFHWHGFRGSLRIFCILLFSGWVCPSKPCSLYHIIHKTQRTSTHWHRGQALSFTSSKPVDLQSHVGVFITERKMAEKPRRSTVTHLSEGRKFIIPCRSVAFCLQPTGAYTWALLQWFVYIKAHTVHCGNIYSECSNQ